MGDISQHIRNWEDCLIGKDRSQMSQDNRIERLLERLRPRLFHSHAPIDGWQVCFATYRGMDAKGKGIYTWLDHKLQQLDPNVEGEYVPADKPDWQPIGLDQSWGDLCVTAFFRANFTVPKAFDGKPMYLLFFTGGDGLLRVNGKDRQGADCFHTEIWMADLAKSGKRLKLEVETYQKHEVDVERFHDLMISSMALLDKPIETLYWDMAAALSGAREGFADPEARTLILHHLDEALKIVDVFEPDQDTLRAAAIKARKYLAKNLLSLDIFKVSGQVCAVGHSHLDIVYKWEYDEYLRKIARTHTTQLRLMDEFPEFKFSQSQAITYIEMKRLYPDVLEQVKRRVKEGRWELLGACYSESDCYLPNGESHIRNIMMGKRFFKEEFGVTPTISWQCDLFGVTWSLPQILKKCGVDYFVTHKMGVWNSDNDWPYNIYWWEGLDGTRVLAHTPSTHIIQTCEGFQVQSHWQNFGEKAQAGQSLYTYGWGDGGSGVMRDMIQRARRYQDFPGVPAVKFDTAEDFFARVNKRIKGRNDVPVWSNELYVETHRGQFTTQGLLKKYNRRAEILYRNAEMMAVVAGNVAGAKYPKAAFDKGWERLLIAQFHDGVTGTHVPKAFEQISQFYTEAIATGESALSGALTAIAGKIDTSGQGKPLVVFNTQTWTRTEPVLIPLQSVRVLDADGNDCPTQEITREGAKMLAFVAADVPGCGYKVFRLVRTKAKAAVEATSMKVSKTRLENARIRVRLDANGHVTSVYDKVNRREIIEAGKLGNEFQLLEDIAGYYEAWDLHDTKNVHKWDVHKAESVKVVETGPLRVAVEVVKKIENSLLTQRIVLWDDATWVDFETTVDWKDEQYKLLKVAFPLDVQNFNCRYDIAFGNQDRPTHRSTTWEKTKFEVVAHKWADLSDAGYGASLINDCKYGYDCEGNVLRLSLLRAPKYPNPQSDLYVHHFTYRLFAHKGDWRVGGTVRNAWQLNCPMIPLATKAHAGTLPTCEAFFGIPNENVILETVKRCEDSDEAIVRLVDHWGMQDHVKFLPGPGLPARTVQEVNLVEEPRGKSAKAGKAVEFVMKPYEIHSLKLQS